VGGGPAGLRLRLLLAKRGAEVLVLEGHENFDREFRGEVLQPSTAHLLDELGLLQYVLEQPHSILDAGKVRLGGKESLRAGEQGLHLYPAPLESAHPLDHLIRAQQQRRRDRQTEGLRGLEVDDQLEFGRLLDG
jgi:2-polyprenyl-6-methoxyphenol hydroxylase-like FAD-dependent oxidoreductase